MRGEHGFDEVLRDTCVEGLKVIPANIDLAGLTVELSAQSSGREMRLARALEGAGERFDYLLVDCPPSLGLLTLNGMCAVREIFIPLQTEFFALHGVGKLIRTVQLVRWRLNPSVEVTGIIPCMFDVRTSLAIEVLEDIRRHFGKRVFETVVRRNVRLAEAPSFGVPITGYQPRCYGAEDYRSLAREVLMMAGEWMQKPIGDDTAPPLPVQAAESATETPLAKAG